VEPGGWTRIVSWEEARGPRKAECRGTSHDRGPVFEPGVTSRDPNRITRARMPSLAPHRSPPQVWGRHADVSDPDLSRALARAVRRSLQNVSPTPPGLAPPLVERRALSVPSRLPASARPPDRHRSRPPPHVDSVVQRSPFRRGSPAWSPLRVATSWRLRERPATAAPRSVLVVLRHLDGLLLQTSARVLHRAPDRRVRRVGPRRPPHRHICPSELSLRR